MEQEINIKNLEKLIQNIDSRLTRIEGELSIRQYEPEFENPPENVRNESENDEAIEFRFGQKWFAKFGIVAFLFAMINLIVLPLTQIPSSATIISGIVVGLSLFLLSFVLKNKINELKGYIFGSSIFILYFTVLKFHFFTPGTVAVNIQILLLPLYTIVLFSSVYSFISKSQYLAVVSVLLLTLNALISNSTPLIFTTIIFSGIISVYASRSFGWDGLLNISIVINFAAHLIWFLNNPLIGNEIISTPQKSYSVVVLLLLTAIYGFGRTKEFEHEINDGYSVVRALMNSVFSFAFTVYLSSSLSKELFFSSEIVLAVLFISTGAYHYKTINSKIATFIYSMTGYASLSIGIINYFGMPTAFIFLCWQSVLVVSTALWFKSKIIVVANFFIFLSILFGNFFIGEGLTSASLNFGLVALISARVINWKKERLGLETQNLRIAYLIIASIINPLVLYKIFPAHFVGLSWIGLAFLYYIFSMLLNNKKYRLMSTFTLILALVYSFIYGLTAGEAIYKVISFAVVSISLILMSFIYSKTKK